MPEYTAIEAAETDLLEHPAVKAWGKLQPTQARPPRVVMLKPDKKRSAVYRLENAGPTGSSVIVKRTRLTNIAIELHIYREVLPRLPIRTLRCYGFAEDRDPAFGWLFLEYAGDERYSSGNDEHRALAAEWLAVLHTSAAKHGMARACLRDRGLEYHRDIVRLVRDTIRRSLGNPALSASDLTVLKAIMSHCRVLELHWCQVKEICNAMTCTLVHGDFSAKNVRTRRGPNGLEIFPLDWDAAGWGIAAADLSQTDVAVYWSIARHHRPGVTLENLKRLAAVGRMFWSLEPVTGEAEPLASNWVENVMRKMRSYETEIADALQAMGWACD